MSSKPKEKALDKEERGELRELHEKALELVGEDQVIRNSEGRVTNRIDLVADYLNKHKGKLSPEEAENASFPLGVLLGAEYCENFKWEWTHLTYSDGFEGFAVIAKDRSILVFPILVVFKVLTDRNQPNNVKMNYNLVKTGGGRTNLSKIKAKSYVPLM